MTDQTIIMEKHYQWLMDHPAERDWLMKNAETNSFAASLMDSLTKWGSLTEKQLAAVQRNLTSSSCKVVDVSSNRLHEGFAKAKASGLKWPRITIGDVVVSMAGDNSRNPGSLYVKQGGEYLGKVTNGKFYSSSQCKPEQVEIVGSLLSDPKAYMKEYGVQTGYCCMCNRELTNPISVKLGIGPICGERFGFLSDTEIGDL